MRLVGNRAEHRLLTVKTREDITPRMKSWAEARLDELQKEDLVAYIFKTKSPSSGLRAVKIYREDGNIADRNGTGIFAGMFTERFPHIPVEDEGRLHDPGIRENFIEKIFVLQRWKEEVRESGASGLVDFHTKHKYTLMAHSPKLLTDLGKLAAESGSGSLERVRNEYLSVLLDTLELKKTVAGNVNVLHHIMGYFKKQLNSDEKAELLEIIEKYRSGFVPIIVPITILNHFVRKYEQPYLKQQYFLNPHPFEIGLLNHV